MTQAGEVSNTRNMRCPYCGHVCESRGIGAVYCGPHMDDVRKTAHPAVRMEEIPDLTQACLDEVRG